MAGRCNVHETIMTRVFPRVSLIGTIQSDEHGQSLSPLPQGSDVHWFGYRKRVSNPDAERADGALDLRATQV
jgi:hypothetical protein